MQIQCTIALAQWFPNCGTCATNGTRRPSKWYAKGLPPVFLKKNIYIHNSSFYLSGSVNKLINFCVAYFPCWFLKMSITTSHSHFVHVAFVSILVFQTFDQVVFGRLILPGKRWYVVTVQDPQMVRDEIKFGKHCLSK